LDKERKEGSEMNKGREREREKDRARRVVFVVPTLQSLYIAKNIQNLFLFPF
jgi:hypothetical protein